jgi:aspartyl-tRNA(Asn)/glutamyl-tRNA(Gln) amidotransferase subunit A
MTGSKMIPPIASATRPLFDTLTDAVKGIESGAFSCQELVEDCIRRIDLLDSTIQAWVSVDRDGAVRQARAADERRSNGHSLSRLDGIPVGIKDIIDVAGWPTMAGFEPWRNRIADQDASIVAELKRAGMIPLGKTVTTQFASVDPPVTKNPWNLDLTPGGSSSGSCAAVACRMVPIALGSQTGGSINRPASFCGVAGLKMGFGDWPVDGVVPCATRLDTLGPIVADPQDLRLVLDTIFPIGQSLTENQAGPNHEGLRILVLKGRFQTLADPIMNEAVDEVGGKLADKGHTLNIDPKAEFFDEELWETHRFVMMAGCFTSHADWFAKYPEHYRPRIRGWVETGEELRRENPGKVAKAEMMQHELASEFLKTMCDYDAIIVPAARGAAPEPETTGDPVMNSPWTLLGVPSLTVPVKLTEEGLPIGVQLIATDISRHSIETLIDLARSAR